MSTYKLSCKKPSLITLILLISFPATAAVFFTPGLVQIIEDFQVTTSEAQLTITVFLFAYAFAQLLYGPIAAKYGRKKSIYLGLGVSFVGFVLGGISPFTHSFLVLVIARVIMGIGSGVGLMITFMIIGDFYYERQSRKVVPYTSLSFGLFPFLGMMLGGFIVSYINWQSCFYFLALYTLVIFFFCLKLPETATHFDAKALTPKHILRLYRKGFSDRRLLLYSMIFGSTTTIIYIFATISPIIVIKILKVPPDIFGLLSLSVSAAYVFGNLLSARLSNYITPRTCIFIAILIMGSAALCLLFFFENQYINLWTLYIPFIVIYAGIPLSFSNAAILAMAESHGPTASSIMNFISMSFAVIGVLMVSAFKNNVFVALPIIVLVVLAVLVFLFFYTRKYAQ